MLPAGLISHLYYSVNEFEMLSLRAGFERREI